MQNLVLCRLAWLNAPARSSDCTWADCGVGTPATAARSRSRTPVQLWVADHPSTQAMGSTAVCWGRAGKAARSRVRGVPPARDSRQLASTSAEVRAAAVAVRLIWKSLGPSPRSRPRGSRNASGRVGPPSVCPTVSTATNAEPPPTRAKAPRRLMVAGSGSAATSPSASGGPGTVSAREVRSVSRKDRARSEDAIFGSLITTCTTNPAMNTPAP